MHCDNVMKQLAVLPQENFMAAVNYRFSKENGHLAEKSTVVMTAMRAKFFLRQEPRAPLQWPK
jgi:protein-arginine kinase